MEDIQVKEQAINELENTLYKLSKFDTEKEINKYLPKLREHHAKLDSLVDNLAQELRNTALFHSKFEGIRRHLDYPEVVRGRISEQETRPLFQILNTILRQTVVNI